MKQAVLLLSGGLDSATVGAMAKAQGFELYALSFRYGQRNEVELKAAANVAKMLDVKEHKTAEIDLRLFGGSALTAEIDVPKDRDEAAMSADIPVTYVPARNTIFLSFALAYAEVVGAYDIFIGVNAVDYSGYPDCRPEFIESFEKMANLATAYAVTEVEELARKGATTSDQGGAQPARRQEPKAISANNKITIKTPLIHLTKAEIIQAGTELDVDYSKTLSCYDPSPDGKACGHCDSCQLRRKGFEDAGVKDPTRYIFREQHGV
jgi:7-cyano-7-deazaguanine synthase